MKKYKMFLISLISLILMVPLFLSALTDEEISLNIIKGDNNNLILTWNAGEYTSVDIYRSTSKNKGYKKITSVAENTYTDSKLTYGNTYYYKLVFNLDENNDFTSKVVYKKVIPNKVDNVNLVSGNKQIKISYDKTNNSGYEIYRSTKSSGGFKKVKTLTSSKTTSFTNTGLNTNTTYYYKVRAYHKIGSKKIYGDYSDIISAKTAPSSPTISSLKAESYNKINVNIKKVSGNSYYEIYRSTNKIKGYTKIGTTENLTFSDENVLPTVTYYYKVKACNQDNICGSYSSIKLAKTVIKTPVLKGQGLIHGVNLNWDETNYVDGYEIYYSTYKTKKYNKIATTSELNYVKDGLIPDKTYYFKIRSYKEINGKKYYSSYSNILTLKPTVKKISNLQLEVYGTTIKLHYTYPIYDDNTIFQLYRSTSKNGKYVNVGTITAGDSFLESNKYLAKDKNLSQNKTYYYKVRTGISIDDKKYYGSFSNIKSAKTGVKLPDYEAALKAAYDEKQSFNNRIELRNILSDKYSFSEEEIEYAVKNIDVNWNYLGIQYANTLLEDLLSKYEMTNLLMEKAFTNDEINYVFAELVIDFKETAYNRAYKYHKNSSSEIITSYLLSCHFTADEIEYAIEKINYNPIEYVNRIDPNTISVGDEVKINDEHFYVVSVNEDKTVLIAKYNLKVGRRYLFDSSIQSQSIDARMVYIGEYTSNDEGYGLQSSDALGYNVKNYNDNSEINGVISFSNNLYWKGKVGINEFGIDEYYGVYGESPYPYVYDNNSNLYEYVNNYVNTLIGYGAPILNGRLLSSEEAVALKCISNLEISMQTSSQSEYDWIYNTSYWLGSAGDNNSSVWIIDSVMGSFFNTTISNHINYYGVRPVIEVYTYKMPGGSSYKRNNDVKEFENKIKDIYNLAKEQYDLDKDDMGSYITYGNAGCYDKKIEVDDNIKFVITFSKYGNVNLFKVTNGERYYSLDTNDSNKFISYNDTYSIHYRNDSEPFELSSCYKKVQYIKRKENNVISPGDIVSIEDDKFIVVSSNDDETVLLSKYNLGTINSIVRQRAVNNLSTNAKNTVYEYVNNYVNALMEKGVASITGRLLRKDEASNLTQDYRKGLGGNTYWLEETDEKLSYSVLYEGTISKAVNNGSYGVRPVIIISTSILKTTYGDVTQDGKINILDAGNLDRYLNGEIELDALALRNADVNADNKVNKVDVMLIRAAIAHLYELDGTQPLTKYALYGDVNSDGLVNETDLELLENHLNGVLLSGQNLKNADINNNGEVNNIDYTLLQDFLNGEYPNTLPTKPIEG